MNETTLRSLQLSDKTQIAKLINNKKIWDNLRDYVPYPYNESDAEYFIKLTPDEKPKQTFGIEYQNEFVGAIGIVLQKDVYKKSAEIGYWIGEAYWGKGIASKAVELITKYGFEELKLVRIFTSVFEYNQASMKVLEKNAYIKEGIFKKAVFKNNKIWDEHRYYKLNPVLHE